MRLVIQRVSRAAVGVRGEEVAAIGAGLLILVGVGREETPGEVEWLASKVANLRIFEDDQGKMNRSVLHTGGAALVVPQFTLYGDVRKGRRPSWADAAPPEAARDGVEAFARSLQEQGVPVRQGAFQKHMEVELVNDGPVTIIMDGPSG